MIVLIILVVLGTSALFGWSAWLICQTANRAERDPRFRRRLLLVVASVYAFGVLNGVSDVLSGKQSAWSLIFVPIPAAIIWAYVKAAIRVKIPPAL
jgi:hypothetical protein